MIDINTNIPTNNTQVSHYLSKANHFSRKSVVAGVVIFIFIVIGMYFLYRGLSGNEVLKKQATMLEVTQGVDQTEAEKKATQAIARTEKIKKEAAKRGITVSVQEIDQEAQKIINESSQELVLQTLKQYGWTEADWKSNIANTLLAEKLSKDIAGWRDYQLLMVRWDNPSKPKFESEDKAWLQAKNILEKARLQLEQGEEIKSQYTMLKADASVSARFEIQAILKTQRIWSYTQIPSPQLKIDILSTPQNSLSQVFRVGSYAVVIKTFDGKDGEGNSLDEFLQKTQGFRFPWLVKSAYAQSIEECAANGNQQYCAVGNYCYTEAVIRGRVKDPAGNPIAGVQVSANGLAGNTACLCTSHSSSATSGGDGGYDIHGLCCFAGPFTVTAEKGDFTCESYPVETPANGTNYDQDVICKSNALPPPPPTVVATPKPTVKPTPTPTPTLPPGVTPTPVPTLPPGVTPTDTPTLPPGVTPTPTTVPACNASCTIPQDCSGAKDGCTVCSSGRCVAPPTPTPTVTPAPTPLPFSAAMCKCDGLDATGIFPGANVSFNAFAKVAGSDTNLATVKDITFSVYESPKNSPNTATRIAQSSPIAAQVLSQNSSLIRYKSTWNFLFPATVNTSSLYRVIAQINCVKKTAMAPPQNVVLAEATQPNWIQLLFAAIGRQFDLIAGIFGGGGTEQLPATPTQSPNPTQTANQKNTLQLQTVNPAIILERSCTLLKFQFSDQ